MRALVLVVAMIGCAPHVDRPSDLPDDPPACVGDDDCAVTRFAGCCACPGSPRVVSRTELATLEQTCVTDCMKPSCPPTRASSLRARCDHHRCVAARSDR